MSLTTEQRIQENQYLFPYHYIPQGLPDFTVSYNWSWGINYAAAIELIIQKLSKIEFESLLDLGTGDGRMVREYAKKFSGIKIAGVDYSELAINTARLLNPGLKFYACDILKDELTEKFDCITLIEVFEHIELDMAQTFAKKTANILNKNGDLIITVPHKNKPLIPKHFQHFTEESLFKYFSDDFELLEVEYIQKSGLIPGLIKNVLCNSFYTLNFRPIKNMLFKYFVEHAFKTNAKKATRLYMHLKKK